MKEYLVGFAIALILALAIFFFYIVPERNKIEKKINEAYHKGLNECLGSPDTVFLPGEPKIIYRDTSLHSSAPAVISQKDSVIKITSSFDSTFVSGKDSISIESNVEFYAEGPSNILDKIKNAQTHLLMNISHKDYEAAPDTIKIQVPKYIETVTVETNWLALFLSFLLGGISGILLFFLF